MTTAATIGHRQELVPSIHRGGFPSLLREGPLVKNAHEAGGIKVKVKGKGIDSSDLQGPARPERRGLGPAYGGSGLS